MASDRPEGEEERREVEDVIEEVEEGSETDGLGSPELMIKHPLQVGLTLGGHGQKADMNLHRCINQMLSKSCFSTNIDE